MSRRSKKWNKLRREFKKDLRKKINDQFACALVMSFTSRSHRTHIHKIWEYLGLNHREAYSGYCSELIGKSLTGSEDASRTIYFCCPILYAKWNRNLPSAYIDSDSYSVALEWLKSRQKTIHACVLSALKSEAPNDK